MDFDRFVWTLFDQALWKDAKPTYEAMLKRVREAYPSRRFPRAEYLQHLHVYENKI